MTSHNIIGRRSELSGLQSFIENAIRGNINILFITGDSGTGKTTLAEEIFRRNHIQYYITQSSEKTSYPYEQTLKLLMQIKENLNLDTETVVRYLEGNEEPAISKTLAITYLKELLIQTADQKPLGLIFDDLQWSDSANLELISTLSNELKNKSVIFICIYRNKEISRRHPIRNFRNDLRRAKKFKEIVLEPFVISETKELITDIIHTKPSDELNKLIWEKTGGIPFFIEAFCETLIEKQISTGAEININDISIPDSLRDMVLLRLNDLSERTYDTLELSAAAGREVDLRMFTSDEQESLSELFDEGILTEIHPGKAVFKHDLIREAIINVMTWSRKRDLNQRAAEFYMRFNYHPDIIAEHWLNAKNYDKASEYFMLSAQKAYIVKAFKDAAVSARKALDYWTPSSGELRRIEILKQFAYCAQLSGMLNEAVEALLEVLDYFTKNKNLIMTAEIYRSLAAAYSLQSKWDLALNYRLKSAQAFEACSLFADAANEYFITASRAAAQVMYKNAITYVEKAIQLSETEGNNEIKARSMGLKGNMLSMMGRHSEGKEIVIAGLNLALENNLIEAASDIYRRLASTMEYASDYTGAVKFYANAYNFCITTGEEISAQICLGCMTYVLFQTGEWNRSLELCEDLIRNSKTPPGSRLVGYAMSALINSLRGNIKTALKYIHKSEELLYTYEPTLINFFILWSKALLAESEKDFTTAGNIYKLILNQWKQTNDRHDAIPVLIWAIGVFAANSSEKDLTEVAEAFTIIINENNNPEALSGLLFVMGELAYVNQQYDHACEHLQRAYEQQNKLNIPLEKILIGKMLAQVLSAQNNNSEASEILEEIYAVSNGLDTLNLSTEIRAKLKELNKEEFHIKNPKLTLLTNRQNEILKNLSEGLTNKEIAAKLFISTRTVDMHVAHIYDKLNCRTRSEAIIKAAELYKTSTTS